MKISLKKEWQKTTLFPLIGGALYPCGFPMKGFSGFFLFSILGLFLYFYSFELNIKKNQSLKTALKSLFFFSLSYALIGYYWIPYTLREFGQVPFPLDNFLGSLFSLIIVPQFLTFVLILKFLTKKEKFRDYYSNYPKSTAIALSFLIVILENIIPQQFPAHPGHTWLNFAPFLAPAKVFGVSIFSFFSYWFIWELIFFIENKSKVGLIFIGSTVLFFLILFLFPLELPREKPNHTLNTRFVQANVGNLLKLNSEKGGPKSIQEVYDRYLSLSIKKSDKIQEDFDLIIWPETAYPELLNSSLLRVNPSFLPRIVRETTSFTKSSLFFGGYDKTGEENKNFFENEYNTGFLVDEKGELSDTYHKKILIPFGESLPFGIFNQYFAQLIPNMAFFGKGKKFTLFELKKGTRFISAICYEILFSDFIRKYLNHQKQQPHFIINLTNDSWYGDTAEPYQHQHLAFWRAIEFQIPILRMTNTGLTSVLYPDGSESERLPIFKKDTLDLKLDIYDRNKTTFQKWGLLPLTILSTFFFFLSYLIERKSKAPL